MWIKLWNLIIRTKHRTHCHIFSGHYRQRGSGFGALAAGIGRFALPLARKIIWPAAKRIGRELISQGAPELVDLVTKKQSAKQALRNTVRKTAKKQLGGSYHSQRGHTQSRVRKRTNRQKRSQKIISTKGNKKRSRSDFFSGVKNAK